MTEKPIIGMFHLLGDTRQGIIDNAIKEMKMKKKYGVAAVLVEESEARVQSIKKRCDEAQREVESSENLIKDLNMNIRQFFLGMKETENIPITAYNLPACSQISVNRRAFTF